MLQPHAAVPLPPWCLKFDKCDVRRYAGLTWSNLDTQTIALGVPTQEQVVNKRWIIQNIVVLARKQSCRRAPKVTNCWKEHAIVLLWPLRNGRMRSLSARDIALRAKGGSLLRHQHRVFEASTRQEAAVAAVGHYHLLQRHRHLNHRHLQNGVWNRRPK